MNFAVVNGHRRALCAVTCVATLATAAVTGVVSAAKGNVSIQVPAKVAEQAQPEKAKSGSVTIEVLLVDPERTSDRQPAVDAMVSVEGNEDLHRTNDKGRTTRFESSAGKITLQIKVIGLDLCKVRDVLITSGDQVVSVLVDRAHKGKCQRAE